jgi:CspA family cold shock protein
MNQGTITRLVAERGFGFIRPDVGGEDLFFHASQVRGAVFETLRPGQRVVFTLAPDRRNPERQQAQDIRPLD